MNDMTSSGISRRRFLGQAGCAALGTSGLISALLNTRLMGQVAAGGNPSDYKALVCLFLLGGNDSYNMLPPRGANQNDSFYQGYLAARGGLPDAGGLALPWDQIAPLSPLDPGLPVGIHHRLPKLAKLFNDDRKLAFVSNVGTLLRPTTSDKLGQSGYLPIGAYSHSDQQEQWQTCFLEGRTALGWGGLMVDSMYGGSVPWASNISIGGVNIWQTGDASTKLGASQPFTVDPNGSSLIAGPAGGQALYQQLYKDAVNSMFGTALESQRPGVLDRVFHRNVQRSNEQAEELDSILNPKPDPVTGEINEDPDDVAVRAVFDTDPELGNNPLAADLRAVARFIALRERFSFNGGPRRQTFFIGLGGWDHHDEVIANQEELFKVVDDAVGAFYQAMTEISAENMVTLFSASDFGRTLTSNGRGSDHGWGGNSFVLGGRVNGGRIYGTYPNLDPADLQSAKLDAGRLRVIPTTSVDQYFATLAKWMDVPQSDFPSIFPNLQKFIDAGEPADLGFLA